MSASPCKCLSRSQRPSTFVRGTRSYYRPSRTARIPHDATDHSTPRQETDSDDNSLVAVELPTGVHDETDDAATEDPSLSTTADGPSATIPILRVNSRISRDTTSSAH